MMKTLDKLTGLYNKQGFFYEVQEALQTENNESYQMISLNVKHFKLINDLFGMQAGDMLLSKIGNILKEKSLPGGIYGHLEADTFCIFIPSQYAQQIIDFWTGTKIYVDQSNSYQVHIYMGVYEIEDKTVPVSVMCDRANMALRTIKENRLVKIAYFEESMRENALKEQLLYGEIQRAIENKEIKIYLQGLYDSCGKILGAEALVRWEHPAKGLLSAGEFIGTLEENGMIVILDQYIWRCACEQLKKWQLEGKDDLFISVNISAKDFDAIDVSEVLIGLVQEYEISPEKLKLELTETAIMQNLEKIWK